MKKIYLFSVLAVAIFVVAALSSCNPLVKPNGGGGTPSTTVISTTIKAVRMEKSTLEGATVTVEGTVICAPGEIAPWWTYIQNGSYGVLVDGDSSDSNFTSLKRGDQVKVTGVVDIPSHGYLEIGKYGNAAQVIKTGTTTVPTATVVSIHDLNTNDDIQGTLIKLENVKLEDTSQWPTETLSKEDKDRNVIIEDTTTGATTTMHIDKDTNIDGSPTPSGTFSVVGVAAYYNAPQILPRDLNDIK